MQASRLKTTLPVAAFIWLISPSFYAFWQEHSPVDSSLLPPLSMGERVMLAPKLILDLLAYWVCPMGREPLTYALESGSFIRQGLFYWLILVIVMRFCWRLRRVDPFIFWGVLMAMLLLIPFSGIVPHWAQPFSALPLLPAGIALAYTATVLFIRGLNHWFSTDATTNRYTRYGWRAVALVFIIWIGMLSLNTFAVMGRTWEHRLTAITSAPDQPIDLIVAVEVIRQQMLKQPEQSESQILRLAQGAPWYPEIPVVMAEMLISRGETAAAQVHLEHALKLAPGHKRATELTLLLQD